jgi:hypothetical protein
VPRHGVHRGDHAVAEARQARAVRRRGGIALDLGEERLALGREAGLVGGGAGRRGAGGQQALRQPSSGS